MEVEESGKIRAKKVHKKKIFGFSKEALDALEVEKNETGKTETQIIEDHLTGHDRFPADVEAWIEQQMRLRGISRRDVILRAMLDVASRRAGQE
jgi:hypothetical protein